MSSVSCSAKAIERHASSSERLSKPVDLIEQCEAVRVSPS
jgi:hypothetical protein